MASYKKRALAVVAAASMAVSLAACGGGGSSSNQASDGGTLYYYVFKPYEHFDPQRTYLGVGIKNPTPTLGNVLSGALDFVYTDFFFFFIPAAIIAAIVISFNLLGDGARDALDPRAGR